MHVTPVHKARLEDVWPLVEWRVVKALRKCGDTHTSDDFYERCMSETAQLWLINESSRVTGLVITEIYASRRGKTCAIPVAAGSMTAMGVVFEVVIPWAREASCTRLEVLGRNGWVKALKSRGFKPLATIVEAEI